MKMGKEFREKVRIGVINSGYKPSIETRKKQSKVKLGSKNVKYIDGRTVKYGYASEFNKMLKDYIKNRDNNECKWFDECDVVNSKISVHHIDYNKHNSDEKNLITLCMTHNIRSNHRREECIRNFKNYINKIYGK